MQDMFEFSQELSDGTYISVTAPGQQMAETAFSYLRTLVRATRPEVVEAKPPEQRLVGRL